MMAVTYIKNNLYSVDSMNKKIKCIKFTLYSVDSVKAACSGKLLQAWLRTFGGNVLELLGSLDVENSTETCELVLKTLLKEAPLPEVVQKFDILDDK